MAKGQQFKKEIQEKILQLFPQSFLYNDAKEIRICGMEDGQLIQVKCVLTCAKENVTVGSDNAIPGAAQDSFPAVNQPATAASSEPIAPTDAEKARVADLLRSLGL